MLGYSYTSEEDVDPSVATKLQNSVKVRLALLVSVMASIPILKDIIMEYAFSDSSIKIEDDQCHVDDCGASVDSIHHDKSSNKESETNPAL